MTPVFVPAVVQDASNQRAQSLVSRRNAFMTTIQGVAFKENEN